ncbi:MAG: glycosyltransferase family 1 protein [Saprospiraceae bacterium]
MYRIGYDAKRLFNNFTGLGNYSRTLLRNLAAYYPDEEYFLYTPTIKRHDQTRYFLDSPMFNVHTPSGMQRLLWRSRGVVNDMARHEVELYHGLSHEIPQGLGKKGIPAVVTIHDLIFKHYPEQYRWWDRQVYDYKFRYACEQSQYVIAISESTKQDVMAFYGIPEEKIRVVYQSCHEGFMVKKPLKTQEAVITKYGLPPDFFLYVGSLIPRKTCWGLWRHSIYCLPTCNCPWWW